MNLAILGSTGSIGRQALEVVKARGDRVLGLAAGHNVALMAEQIALFAPEVVSLADDEAIHALQRLLAQRGVPCPTLKQGREGVCAVATHSGVKRIVAAMSGFSGFAPVLAALECGIDVALANKETLVAAGPLVLETARAHGASILPVDSEHAAVFQCLGGRAWRSGETIVLTCSGGPFRGRTRADLTHVTVEEALAHPTWSMGAKISIDSATLMNKALELIEAVRLFAAPPEAIRVVMHPESVVHSMVSFADGSTLAQLGHPDMRLALFQSLSYPATGANTCLRPFDLTAYGQLTFRAIDEDTFPAIRLARRALALGPTAPLVLNAANEAAVALFLRRRVPFLTIYDIVSQALDRYASSSSTAHLTPDAMMDMHARVVTDILARYQEGRWPLRL